MIVSSRRAMTLWGVPPPHPHPHPHPHPRLVPLLLPLVLCLLCIVVPPADATIRQKKIESARRLTRFSSFTFLRGGTLDVSSTFEDEDVLLWLMVCTHGNIYKASMECSTINSTANQDVCAVSTQLYSGGSVQKTLWTPSRYDFFLVNCEQVPYTALMKYTLMNPNGEHLSAELIPLPRLYFCLLLAWLVVCFMWGVNWFRHRLMVVTVYRVLSSLPVLKLVSVLLYFIFWAQCSRTGLCPFDMYYLYLVVDVVYRATVVGSLSLLSKGWMVVRVGLSPLEMRQVGGCILLYSTTILIGSTIFGVLCVVAYGCVFGCLCVWAFRSLGIVSQQTQMQRAAGVDMRGSVVLEKRKVYRWFWGVIVVFAVGNAVVRIVELTTERARFFTELAQEALQLILFICVGCAFRLRTHSIYVSPERSVEAQDESTRQSLEAAVVVINPMTLDSMGNIVPSVLMARREVVDTKSDTEEVPETGHAERNQDEPLEPLLGQLPQRMRPSRTGRRVLRRSSL